VQLTVRDPQDTVVFTRVLHLERDGLVPLDLSALPPERYALVIERGGAELFRTRLRVWRE
jgi:hypothetical protein